MTTPNNFEAQRQRVTERFESALVEEGLTVSPLLANAELLSMYGDQVVDLSQEAYGRSPEQTRDWVMDCTRAVGFRAMVLTTQTDQLAGYAWGVPVAEDPGADMEIAADFMAERRRRQNVAEGNEVYSNALVIAPEYRRKGLGSGLALAAIRQGRQELYPDGALLFYRARQENAIVHRTSEMLGALSTGISGYNKDLWMAHIPPASIGASH